MVKDGTFFPRSFRTTALDPFHTYNRRPTQQELNNSRRDAIGRLASDLSLVSDWGRANLVLFNASNSNAFHTARAMHASANIRGLTFANYLCFQWNFSHGAEIVLTRTKCSAGVPWLVCRPASSNFAKDYSVQCVFTRHGRWPDTYIFP